MADTLARQLHASISLNLFAEAARLAIPLLKDEYDEISSAATYALTQSGDLSLASFLQSKADDLLEALMASQIALKEAGPLVKPAVRVVEHKDGDPRNYELGNLRIMQVQR